MGDLNDILKVDGTNYPLAQYLNELYSVALLASLNNTQTISATKTLTDADYPIQILTPSGSNQDVKLPAIGTSSHPFVFYNADSTNSIVLKDSTAATTYLTLGPGEGVYFIPVYGQDWTLIENRSTLDAIYLLVTGLSEWDEQGSTPSTPSTSKWKLYFKSDGLYFIDDTGAETGPLGTGSSGLTSGPQGFADNYVITPSIDGSNNLVVAMKTVAGSDPSGGDAITVRIADAKRTLSAALSLTVNAGSSVFLLGSSELAGNKTQLFVYLGYRASDTSIFLGLSPMPYGRTYGDFSGTSTDQDYLAYTGAAPASTDPVEVIGRIDVQNSGSASYNWSLPSGAEVVNHYIRNTDVLYWNPVRTGFSVDPSSITYFYWIQDRIINFAGSDHNNGTSNANTNKLTIPFLLDSTGNNVYQFVCACNDNSTGLSAPSYGAIYSGTTDWKTIEIGKDFSYNATAWTASGSKRVRSITGFGALKEG